MQILLPKISDWECYYQLLEAMDPPLLAGVRPCINDSMEWKELNQQCEIHDSVHHTKKLPQISFSKNGQKLYPQQQTHHTSSYLRSSSKPCYQSKVYQKPQNASGRFPQFTCREKQELAKKAGCFYCRKVGHQAKDCPLKKPQITTAAGTIQQGSQPPTSNTPNEISSAAQSLKISETVSHTPRLKHPERQLSLIHQQSTS